MSKVQTLIVRSSDNQVLGTLLRDDPSYGPIEPQGGCPVDGAYLVEYADEVSWVGRAASEIAYWTGTDVEWVDPRTIEQLRAARKAEINAWKLEANSTYFDFAGEQIAYRESDRVEIQAINNVVALTGTMPNWPDWPRAWKAISNRWVPLPDVATWTAFNIAIGERGTNHFKRAQQLKAAVDAAATPADIEAITW